MKIRAKLHACLIIATCARATLATTALADEHVPYGSRFESTRHFAKAELRKYLRQMGSDIGVNNVSIRICKDMMPAGLESHEEDGILLCNGGNGFAALHCVYRALHKGGCRFLSPAFGYYADDFERIPQNPAIKLNDLRVDYHHPALEYRKIYVEEGLSHTTDTLKAIVDWMPKAGFNVLSVPMNYGGRGRVMWDHWRDALIPELEKRGILLEVGGHGYQNFLSAGTDDGALFRQHPEWFGMDEKGERRKATAFVFCTSNADARAHLSANVVAYLRERPEIAIFDFWPPDGAKWCACSECTKLGDATERQALLLEEVRQKLEAEKLPVRLEIIAYSDTLAPPKRPAPKEVMVDFCPIAQSFEKPLFHGASPANAKYLEALQAWRKSFSGDLCLYSYYRKYAWKSIPVQLPQLMSEEIRWYKNAHLNGISSYAEPGDWATYELNHYALGQLAMDPSREPNEIRAEFCDARYGSSGSAFAQECLADLERDCRNFANIPGTTLKPAEAIADARKRLERRRAEAARYAASGETNVNAPAFGRLGLMLEYAARDLALQESRSAGRDVTEIRRQAEELFDFLNRHRDSGTFLVNEGKTSETLLKRYGATP